MFCPQCGASLFGGGFCPHCGASVASGPSNAAAGVTVAELVDQSSAGRSRWWTRRRNQALMVVVALAIGGVIVGIVIATRGSTAQPPAATSNAVAAITDAPSACTAEVNAGLDTYINAQTQNQAPQALFDAIGLRNAQIRLAQQLAPTMYTYLQQTGSADAETKIVADIRRACAAAKNPVLTRGQLQAMIGVVTAGDAALLQTITYVG